MLAKKPLTDVALAKMKPAEAGKRKVIWDAGEPGFAVRVNDRGRRTFVLVKRFPGETQPEYRSIGEYGAISLEEARETARAWNKLIKAGKDPAVEAAQEKRDEEERKREKALQDADTVDAVFALFVTHHLAKLRTGEDVAAVARRWMLPAWGGRPSPASPART